MPLSRGMGGGAAAAALTAATSHHPDDNIEARVYVNNMNTAHATVALPDRSGNGGGGRNMGRSAALRFGRDQNLDGDGVFVGGATRGETSAAATTVNYSDHGSGKVVTRQAVNTDADGGVGVLGRGRGKARGRPPNGKPGSRAGVASEAAEAAEGARSTGAEDEGIHPNLEAVYSRIMRRLQRKMNYEELTRTSLADQYGIAVELEEEQEQGRQSAKECRHGGEEGEEGEHLMPAVITCSGGDLVHHNDDKNAAAARARDSFLNNTAASHSARAAPIPMLGEDKEKKESAASMIVRYGRRQNIPAARAAIVSSGPNADIGLSATPSAAADSDAGIDDVEMAFASQPCPRPLRLIVQHVQETLMNKMAMAERGSMKDCLRLAFESRALLDRLLKEAPTYAAFPTDTEGLPHRAAPTSSSPSLPGYTSTRSSHLWGDAHGPASAARTPAHQLHEMYQEFRKRPVLLPRATYTQDPATGAIGVTLDFAQEAALGLHREKAKANGNDDSMERAEGTASVTHRPSTALPPPLPAAPTTAIAAAAGRKTLVSYLVSAADDDPTRGGGRSPSQQSVSLNVVNPAASTAMDGEQEVVLPPSYAKSSRCANDDSLSWLAEPPGHELRHSSSPFPHTGRNSTFLAATADGSAAATMAAMDGDASTINKASHARGITAAVSSVSVGTLTDENASNIITRDMYEAVQAYAADLEVQLAEARSSHDSLASKLLEEESYVDSRRRVMDYLRTTLVRECNMLRSQLYFAANREQNLQQALKDKQQQQQVATMGGSSGNYNAGDMPSATSMASRSHAAPGGGGGGGSSMALSRGWFGGGRQSIAHTTAGEGLGRSTRANSSNENSRSCVSEAAVGSPAGAGGGARFLPHGRLGTSIFLGMGGNDKFEQSAVSVSGVSNNNSNVGGAGAVALASSDITSMQSLLDLVLLAVENDEVFPTGLGAVPSLEAETAKLFMTKDLKHQADALRANFEEKSKRLQDSVMAQRIRNSYIVMGKDKEIAQLTKMADMSYVHARLQESVRELRTDQRKMKNAVNEALQSFRIMMDTTVTSVLNRARLMDETASDNTALQNTQDALKDLVDSAYSLLAPMLTTEYARGGYHPWPLKLRNSTDPLAHVIQSRYGAAELVPLRESLTTLSELYVALHQFVVRHTAYPDAARPAVGEPLRLLCARLALNPRSNTDVIFEVRQRYDSELRLQRAIAKANFRLLWNVYLQRVYTERSVTALTEAGMDPYTTTLPVGRLVNELAAERGAITHQRNDLLKERLDNAKQVYRVWREKAIDINEGFSAPASATAGVGGRLAVLAAAHPALVPPASVPAVSAAASRATSLSTTTTARTSRLPSLQPRGLLGTSFSLTGSGEERRGTTRTASTSTSHATAHQAQSYLGSMVEAPMTGRS